MKLHQGFLSALLAGLLVMGMSGCEKDGPAENAGEAIDDAAEDMADQAEDTKDAMKDKMN